MYKEVLFLLCLLLLGGSPFSNSICEAATTTTCDTNKAVQCGQEATVLALNTGCQVSVVLPVLEQCVLNYTSTCDIDQREQWQLYITNINNSLSEQLCYEPCSDTTAIQTLLDNCMDLNGGLALIAEEILQYGYREADSACILARKVMDCMLNATVSCEKLHNAALVLLHQHEQAFTQCNIYLMEIATSPPIDANVTTTPTPGNTQGQLDSTKITLYIALGISTLIVVVAGIILITLWLRGQRRANFIKSKKDNRASETIEERGDTIYKDDSYFTRDRSPRRSRRDDEDRFSEHSIGPYRPSGRWWTRPGFGTYGYQARQPKNF